MLDCAPDAQAELALYWTGALDEVATPGADCEDLDWTCAGESLLGIERYAAELGDDRSTRAPTPSTEWHRDAPETSTLAEPLTSPERSTTYLAPKMPHR